MSIRVRLAAALVLALTPVLALGVLEALNAFNYETQARRAQLVQAAQRSAVVARAQVAAAQTLLESVTPQTVGLECGPRLAQLADRLGGYTNLARVNAAARVECSARSVTGTPESRAARPWFRRLAAGERFVLARSQRGGDPEVVAAHRVDGPDGAFAGAVVALIPLKSLQPPVRDPALPAGSAIELVDGAGAMLTTEQRGAFAPVPPGLKPDASGQRLFTARTPSGEVRTHAVEQLLDDANVELVLSAPQPGLISWARLNPLTVLVLPVLAWLLALAAVWIVTDRVVIRWLRYLDRVAALYARGRFSVRPVKAEHAPQEIRALAQTLDVMADAIIARDQTAREHLAQKDALMREIHHRVKNNLQVITSLLNMQQRSLSDPEARAAMYDTRQRITALALIYRALYQSPDLRRVDVRQFLEELIAQLVQAESAGGRSGPIRTDLVADDLEIDPDKLAPLALFAVEAITQARKAAQVSGGEIHVRFAVAEEVTLEIRDDGTTDLRADPGDVGRTLMTAYARQLRGRCEVAPDVDGGRVQRLVFPAPEAAHAAPHGAPATSTEPPASATPSGGALGNPIAA